MNPNFNPTIGFKFPFGNVDNNSSSISKFQWGFLRGRGEKGGILTSSILICKLWYCTRMYKFGQYGDSGLVSRFLADFSHFVTMN